MEYRRIRLGQIGNSKRIAFAVSELARFLKKMDPELVIDVLKSDSVKDTYSQMIWVGLDKSFSSKVPEVTEPSLDDAVVVDIKDSMGYITGSNERSVLLAVYRFLKELGCDWVRPGIEGERIPHLLAEDVNGSSITDYASVPTEIICATGVLGDINGTDGVDVKDIVRLKKYLSDDTVAIALADADINSDGYVDDKDLVLVREIIVGKAEFTNTYNTVGKPTYSGTQALSIGAYCGPSRKSGDVDYRTDKQFEQYAIAGFYFVISERDAVFGVIYDAKETGKYRQNTGAVWETYIRRKARYHIILSKCRDD